MTPPQRVLSRSTTRTLAVQAQCGGTVSAEGVGQPRQHGRRRILLGSVPLRRRPIPGTDLGGKGVGIDEGDSLRKVGGHRQIRRSDDSPPSLGQCILQASPGAGWGRIETDLHEMARIALQQDGPQFAEPGDELPRIALASRRRQAEIAVIQQNHRQIGSELVEARLRVQNLLPVITVDAFVRRRVSGRGENRPRARRGRAARWWNWRGLRVSPCGAAAIGRTRRCDPRVSRT